MSQSITLKEAVILQVTEFAQAGTPFSAHDITRNIRSKARNKTWDIPETKIAGSSFYNDIPHNTVRDLFNSLRDGGDFDPICNISKYFNGTYFEYTPTLNTVTTPSFQPPTAPAQPTTNSGTAGNQYSGPTSGQSVSKREVQSRIDVYLAHCKTKGFRPTLKQVQSAIKRDVSTGWSCTDLRTIIESDLGYVLLDAPTCNSEAQVIV